MEAMAPITLSFTDAGVKAAAAVHVGEERRRRSGNLSMAVTIELPLLDIAKCIVELQKAHQWGEGNWED
eukprot:7239681-Prorocentrum_lima.AAC.1